MEMESEKLCAELMETTATLPINDGGSSPPEAVAVPDVNMLQESDDGKSWMDQLNMLKKKIEALQENYDQSYLEIGKVLIKARDIYKGHGKLDRMAERKRSIFCQARPTFDSGSGNVW